MLDCNRRVQTFILDLGFSSRTPDKSKTISLLDHNIITSLYNSANSKNVSVTILIAVWNIKVFLITRYTQPVLKKYILT